MTGECLGMLFCLNSESSSDDTSAVALGGNCSASSAKPRTGVKAPAKAAADSTSARTKAEPIKCDTPGQRELSRPFACGR